MEGKDGINELILIYGINVSGSSNTAINAVTLLRAFLPLLPSTQKKSKEL